MRPLILIFLASVALPACAPSIAPPAPKSAPAVASLGCDEAFRVAGDAWTIEGFGGREKQLIVSQRRPVKRCAPSAVSGPRTAVSTGGPLRGTAALAEQR